VLTNREQRRFDSSSSLDGGVFLTLTEARLARAAQVTFGTIQESVGSTDAAIQRATLYQVIETLTLSPLVLCQCPQAHPYFLQNVHLTPQFPAWTILLGFAIGMTYLAN
jgi:hypothetical protein